MSNVPMTLPELAISIQGRPFSHTSTFLELDDGRIFHVCNRVCQYSEDRGLSWSEVKLMQDIDGNPVGSGGCSLVRLSGKNEIGLAAVLKEQTADWPYAAPRRCDYFLFWRSTDNGQTWQKPVRMTAPGFSVTGNQDLFVRTSSGRLLLPVFSCMGQSSGPGDREKPMNGRLVDNQYLGTAGHFYDPIFTAPFVVYSDDDGRTWSMNKDGYLMNLRDWNAIFSYGNESSVAEVSSGRLLMFIRNVLGRIFQAWSNDNGETWTRPQPTSLASSTCPAQLRTLPNGHLLCIWNQETEEEIKRGYNRSRLSSAISRNGGSVWEFFQNIESLHETTRVEPGPIRPTRPEEIYFSPGHAAPQRDPQFIEHNGPYGRWSYPSVLVMEDRVLVAYSYTRFEPHPTEARMVPIMLKGSCKNAQQKLKILPLKWFYGGKEPADNPFLKTAYEPAKP